MESAKRTPFSSVNSPGALALSVLCSAAAPPVQPTARKHVKKDRQREGHHPVLDSAGLYHNMTVEAASP